MEPNKKIELENSHKRFWEQPEYHGLLKEEGEEGYSIFTIYPVFMMLLCDDVKYANALTEKMIDNGVRVFYNFRELSDFSKEIISKQNSSR